MCTGAILLYKIPRVVIGENENFKGDEELLRSRGVEVIVVNDEECKKLMKSFIREHPEVSVFFYTSNIIQKSLSEGMVRRHRGGAIAR